MVPTPLTNGAQSRRPMAADDLYNLRFVADARISPDGSRVAYVCTWVDRDDRTRYRSALMLAPSDASSPPRKLTSGQYRDTAPRWSPDGRRIAFLSDRGGDKPQLHVLPLDGGDALRLTDLKYGAGAPVWSPDGARIAFAASVDIPEIEQAEGWPSEKGKSPRVRYITRVSHKGDGAGFFEERHRHLFVVDTNGCQEPRQVTDGDWDEGDVTWSPDGQHLAFTANREDDRDISILSDVWVVSAAGGEARRLTEHKGAAATPSFSPDGKQVAYVGHERGWTYGVLQRLQVVPIEGGASRCVSDAYPRDVTNATVGDMRDPSLPLAPAWSSDGRSLFIHASDAGRVSVLRFSVEGGEPEVLVGGEREVAGFSVSADGQTIAFVASDPVTPYEVFVRAADGTERRISHENDAFLAGIQLAQPEPISFTSTDGGTVHGWLFKPVGGAGGKQPLVLQVHGGPEAQYSWTFTHEFQVMAGRGYGVLATNPRGGKGYGEQHAAHIFANWGTQDADDCLAAVDAALATTDWIDPDRLYLTGGSYGGYMTAWLVGHDHRFRAAVAQRGVYNWSSFYGTSDIGPTFGDYVLGGPQFEKPDLYVRVSPMTYASEVRTPLRLIHNEGDLRCPIEQAEQLYVHLRRIGRVETDFVRFPEEHHNLSRSGRPDRRVERLERIVEWFDRHGGLRTA